MDGQLTERTLNTKVTTLNIFKVSALFNCTHNIFELKSCVNFDGLRSGNNLLLVDKVCN